MADLPRSASELAKSQPQLPVSWYFDERLLALEKRLLFDGGPGYVGHSLMVPETGDYHTLEWKDHAQMLVRDAGGAALLDNICRHRQAIMHQGRGRAQNIVCPVHRWTYGLDGRQLGAPNFSQNPCRDLVRTPLTEWNGLLFSGKRDVAADLAGVKLPEELDPSRYVYDRTVVTTCRQNWKTFVEIYVELYHVEPFHPGLGSFVTCDDLRWEAGDWHSLQTVGVRDSLRGAGTPAFERFASAVKGYYGDQDPGFGAVWFLYYPNVMLEWYPHSLVISTVWPKSVTETVNVIEFYYPEDIALFEREFVEAQQAAYLETAVEDDEIGVRIDRGRRALLESGRDDMGPYQSPLEDGMVYFHEYLHRELGPHLGRAWVVDRET